MTCDNCGYQFIGPIAEANPVRVDAFVSLKAVSECLLEIADELQVEKSDFTVDIINDALLTAMIPLKIRETEDTEEPFAMSVVLSCDLL